MKNTYNYEECEKRAQTSKQLEKEKKKEISKRLHELRKKQEKLTIEDLAVLTDLSTGTIKKWEKKDGENTVPSLVQLYMLSDIYKCDLNYLLCLQDFKSRDINFICEETGLTEEAVNILVSKVTKARKDREGARVKRALKEYYSPHIAFSSFFIEYGGNISDEILSLINEKEALEYLKQDIYFSEIKQIFEDVEKYKLNSYEWMSDGFFEELQYALEKKYPKAPPTSKQDFQSLIDKGLMISHPTKNWSEEELNCCVKYYDVDNYVADIIDHRYRDAYTLLKKEKEGDYKTFALQKELLKLIERYTEPDTYKTYKVR